MYLQHPASVLRTLQRSKPATLADLLTEAERNNPQIQAARHGWQSAKQVPTQASTLPDPQLVLQQMSVGSPRPFAGYTNSDFAYVGLGVSQDFPYPGKLRLRGEIAKKDADVTQQKYESVRRAILADVKMAYFQLGYLAKQQTTLEEDGTVAPASRAGGGSALSKRNGKPAGCSSGTTRTHQALREITTNQLEAGKMQAEIKQLLNRPQSSPDIETAELSETAVAYTYRPTTGCGKNEQPRNRWRAKNGGKARAAEWTLPRRISIRISTFNTCGSGPTPRNSAPITN